MANKTLDTDTYVEFEGKGQSGKAKSFKTPRDGSYFYPKGTVLSQAEAKRLGIGAKGGKKKPNKAAPKAENKGA